MLDPNLYALEANLEVEYDNSKPFKEYLVRVKADRASRANGLSMRSVNNIVPSVSHTSFP